MFLMRIVLRGTIGVVLMLLLSQCGAIDDAAQTLDAPTTKKFAVKDVDTFRISDDIRESRITITASSAAIGSAALNGFFTFGLSNPDIPQTIMKSAVVSYLKSTSRNCNVDEGTELSRMHWVFQYQC